MNTESWLTNSCLDMAGTKTSYRLTIPNPNQTRYFNKSENVALPGI